MAHDPLATEFYGSVKCSRITEAPLPKGYCYREPNTMRQANTHEKEGEGLSPVIRGVGALQSRVILSANLFNQL